MAENNLYPQLHSVNQSMRSLLNKHLPLVLWFTGLSGSGKTTIANKLEIRLLSEFNAHTYLLDGDNIRIGLNAGLGFSKEDRKENIRRTGEVAKLMFDAGLIVLTALISPFRADRDLVRSLFYPGAFWEIYVSCPLDLCMLRDPKGLYQKAIKGEIPEFSGISSPYEPPLSPELVIESHRLDIDQCVSIILDRLIEKKIITFNK
jgi:adenylylsulfate kinase